LPETTIAIDAPASPEGQSDLERKDDQSIVTYRTGEPDSHVDHSADQAQTDKEALSQPSAGLAARFSRRIKSGIRHTLYHNEVLPSLVLLGSIVGLSAIGGYLVGTGALRAEGVAVSAMTSSVADPQSAPVASVADAQSDAIQAEMTRQMGQLRAELLRLHSVFVQLADLAELADGAIQYSTPGAFKTPRCPYVQ